MACGANHALALDADGIVYAWGSGQQNQLGRRIMERRKLQSLVPGKVGLPKHIVTDISCGEYHSFALDIHGRVWAWGLNNYGQTGIPSSMGENEAFVLEPQLVHSLSGQHIVCIKGGAHHSAAVSRAGSCFTWGRVDAGQVGVAREKLHENDVIKDERGHTRILTTPTMVATIPEPVAMVTAQSDHSMAVTVGGKAYGWGYAASNQLGLGGEEEEHPTATVITDEAIADQRFNSAYAGGQFGILTSVA